jgi:glycosyltransferase involved in cell wall biosynthesis
MNRFIITRAIRRWIQALGLQRPLVWTFLPTPLALDIIDAIEPTLVIYYCIDDFESSSSGARLIRQAEDRLLKAADLVFVTSERLRHRVLEQREQLEVLPFAVDFPRFEKERLANQSKPNELVEIDSPIVGYVGGLHRWVDQELLVEAARVLPDVEFVFVGPEQCDMSKLKAQPNIHLLGSRNYDELPRYIKCFDVGLIPYVLSEYALNVYPTKLNEYLAMGLPVVATNLPEVRKFNEDFNNVVRIADDSASFASQIQESLAIRTTLLKSSLNFLTSGKFVATTGKPIAKYSLSLVG